MSGNWKAEIVTEIYDTTQPADSTTGTPPLLSRVREMHEATNRSESRTKADVEKQDSTITEATATSSKENSEKKQEASAATGKSQSESSEEKGVSRFYMWASNIMLILSIAIFLYGLYIVIKYLSNNH